MSHLNFQILSNFTGSVSDHFRRLLPPDFDLLIRIPTVKAEVICIYKRVWSSCISFCLESAPRDSITAAVTVRFNPATLFA